MNSLTDTYTLANGVRIPCVGFGTWQTEDAEPSTRAAIELGYRHIDTAFIYGNETSVAKAIHGSGVPREELFITTKLWNAERGYESTLAAFEVSMRNLGLDYLDLYLIHWPANAKQFDNWAYLNAETWRAFEDLHEAGRIKAIGLSNFTPLYIDELMKTARIAPMVDQLEVHPGYDQKEAVAYCKANNILVEAWSPIGSGRLLDDPMLVHIAGEYGVSVAQLCIRWCLQHDLLPLPKSVTPEYIAQNADVFGFEIDERHMKAIDDMDDIGFSGMHPDEVDF